MVSPVPPLGSDDKSHRSQIAAALNTLITQFNKLLQLPAHSVVLAQGGTNASPTGVAPGAAGTVLTSNGPSADPSWQSVTGKIAQIVNFETGALATGTGVFSLGNTIPTNTNGDQYMSLSITPTNANSKLIIDVAWFGSSSLGGGTLFVGLFQDSITNALAAVAQANVSSGSMQTINFRHVMVAGATSPTTFKVRAGFNAASTTTFNGQLGSGIFAGTLPSSITITEVLP